MANKAERGRIVWHELMTSDSKAAQDFYTKVIGWKTQAFGPDYTIFQADSDRGVGGVMAITPEAKEMGAPPSWTTYVEVPDCDASVAQATKLGATTLVPPQDIPTVGRFAVLQDPQGAVFAIITSEPAGEPETDCPPLGFSWHELMTTDYKAAFAFYEAMFGWVKKDEMDMGKMGVYLMFGRDRFTYGGIMNRPEHVPVSFWLPYILVDSADATAEKATKAGAKLMNGPMEVPGGDRIAVLTDPQGAHFALHSKKK
jgi:predicted enzyme related to lactoylglutathione lyase